jgi:hypothetical protein
VRREWLARRAFALEGRHNSRGLGRDAFGGDIALGGSCCRLFEFEFHLLDETR